MLSHWRSAIVSFGLILFAPLAALAQFGVPLNHSDSKLEPATVRELVAHYCRADYAGARLNPADWPKIQPMVAWRENPDFPLFMVTSRFDVDADFGFEHGKYEVIVHYRQLGKYDISEGYSQGARDEIEDVRYVVSEVNGEWRIAEIEPSYPHPSRAAALQWVNQRLATAQDPMAKSIYQHAADLLQTQKSLPLAK
ncbi:MAG TPA: hypothetical protein VE779_04470 [Candidatus Angelobacter sp.]|nr:hypothetical protein [Candidatus Angelobacter sp.]